MKKIDPTAAKRMEVIMNVQTGLITAREAARQLNVSRTTYYKWEEKALEGMYLAVSNGEAGRPMKEPDPEKRNLNEQITQLRQQVLMLEQDREIRKLLFGDINPGVDEGFFKQSKKKTD